jgi:hypothetical protein
MITVERDEVFVPCISGMQHLAVSGRNEIIAIRMAKSAGTKVVCAALIGEISRMSKWPRL